MTKLFVGKPAAEEPGPSYKETPRAELKRHLDDLSCEIEAVKERPQQVRKPSLIDLPAYARPYYLLPATGQESCVCGQPDSRMWGTLNQALAGDREVRFLGRT